MLCRLLSTVKEKHVERVTVTKEGRFIKVPPLVLATSVLSRALYYHTATPSSTDRQTQQVP